MLLKQGRHVCTTKIYTKKIPIKCQTQPKVSKKGECVNGKQQIIIHKEVFDQSKCMCLEQIKVFDKPCGKKYFYIIIIYIYI